MQLTFHPSEELSVSINIYFRGRPEVDGERFRLIFFRAMAATGSSNPGDRWDCMHDEAQFHVFVWGPESLDCHTYFGAGPLLLELPPGFEATPLGKLLTEGEITPMFVETAPLCEFDGVPFRRNALAVAEILTPEAVAICDWWMGRLAPVTSHTSELLRSSDPRRAFDGGVQLARPGRR